MLLIERKMRPADLAAATGLSIGYVYNLLTGHTITKAGRKKIEAVLGPIWSEGKQESEIA